MKEGGNCKFKEFLEEYKLNKDSNETKYKTNAAEYYRKRVLI